MSKTAATRARPLSPHLQVYRFIPTMAMSIIHRITGSAMYFGSVLIVAWLLAAATYEAWFECVSWIYGSWFGLLVLFGYTWAIMHHLIGGLRHLVFDTGAGLEKHFATKVARIMPFISAALTVLVWIAVLMVRGA